MIDDLLIAELPLAVIATASEASCPPMASLSRRMSDDHDELIRRLQRLIRERSGLGVDAIAVINRTRIVVRRWIDHWRHRCRRPRSGSDGERSADLRDSLAASAMLISLRRCLARPDYVSVPTRRFNDAALALWPIEAFDRNGVPIGSTASNQGSIV